MKRQDTSWQNVSDWYEKIVGKEGHYYHQQIILPGSLALLGLNTSSSLLDLACGQGVLARRLPREAHYAGVDISPALISQAKRLDKNKKHIYLVADISRDLKLSQGDFSHACIILALQNVADPSAVIRNAHKYLKDKGKFLIVINHPCFRIPRQSRWGVDEQNKVQYRRIDRYMTDLSIPITAHPGQGERSEVTWTYHKPLSEYVKLLSDGGFVLEKLEEWISDKQSVGDAAKMENRARNEFPLFLALLARKG
jgi:ubiquinone/menaquinone biosynthesis C-methylase UbiE